MKEIIRPKCCNASYCRYSADDIRCYGDDKVMENCPYVKAMNRIECLSAELAFMYDDCK